MTTDGGPGRALGWTLVGLGVATAAAGLAAPAMVHPPAPDLVTPSRQARARVEQSLASRARTLEPKAAEAARVPELAAALNMGADQETFQDLLESEDWWAPYRSAYPLTGVVVNGRPLAVIGPGAGALGSSHVVRAARENGIASEVLPGQGRAFLAAAARVSHTKRGGEAPVVVLGTALGEAALKEISGSTGDALGISDRTKLVEAAGAAEPGRALQALVGHEDRGPVVLPDGRIGTAWSLGGEMWMLSASAAPPPAPPAGRGAGLWALLGGAALLLAGLGTVFLRRRAPAAAAASSAAAATDASVPSSAAPSSPGRPAPLPVRTGPRGTELYQPKRSPVPLPAQGVTDAHAPTAAAVELSPTAGSGAGIELGRYRLLERVGEGGMAEIFFAAAHGVEDFVRHFVVKRLHPHLARNREIVNQFIDEARLQAALVHSNIVPVFDFGKAGEEYFLALEYIHGRDVGQLVQRHVDRLGRPLDLEVAFYIAHEVLEALAFAHSRTSKEGKPLEIVHRDVAPGNVLVSYLGEVKLTDFGIAKAEKRVSRTEVGMVKGNASFMSPEQARGETVDRRSDLFSAALVLYYCLTGQLLYRGETTLNRLLRAAVGPATSQFSQIDRLPPAAAQVLRRALALDPAQRYASAADFKRDVEPHAGARPQLAALMDTLFPEGERRDMR